MTNHPSSQAQAKVALPPLPEPELPSHANSVLDILMTIRTRDEPTEAIKRALHVYGLACYEAGIAQDRAARAQAEPVPLSCRDSHEASLKYVEGWEAAKADSAARAQGAGEAVAWEAKILGEWTPTRHPDNLRRDGYEVRPVAPTVQGDQPTPAGYVLVPREFVQGFGTLAHNWSLKAEPPCYYYGLERDAFAAAYRECGQALGKLRDILNAAAPQPLAASEAEPKVQP